MTSRCCICGSGSTLRNPLGRSSAQKARKRCEEKICFRRGNSYFCHVPGGFSAVPPLSGMNECSEGKLRASSHPPHEVCGRCRTHRPRWCWRWRRGFNTLTPFMWAPEALPQAPSGTWRTERLRNVAWLCRSLPSLDRPVDAVFSGLRPLRNALPVNTGFVEPLKTQTFKKRTADPEGLITKNH